MLKELLDFASQGCIDITDVRAQAKELKKLQETDGETPQVKEKRAHVLDLIQKLRQQTEDLEKFAYDFGHGGMPMSELKLRQKMVFDKLQEKIRLKIDMEDNDPESLRKTLDEGIEQ
uniref:LZ3wCH domain-containing protein n=2 Tax=Bursaphelenchus xylophilus TaxID=6326 RepID=A0A1I7SJQ7_BURXY